MKRLLIAYNGLIGNGIGTAWGNIIVAAKKYPSTADDIDILQKQIVEANAKSNITQVVIMNIIPLADEEGAECFCGN